MKKAKSNRIGEIRKQRKMTQAQLAERLGVHWVTVSKLERGEMQLTMRWLEEISEALNVPMDRIFVSEDFRRDEQLGGYILRDGNVRSESEFEEFIPIRTIAEEDLLFYWLAVDGDALWPIFHHEDLIKFVDYGDNNPKRYCGWLCHVVTQDGTELVGILSTPDEGKSFDLNPPNARPLRGVKITKIGVAVGSYMQPPM